MFFKPRSVFREAWISDAIPNFAAGLTFRHVHLQIASLELAGIPQNKRTNNSILGGTLMRPYRGVAVA